MDKEFEVESGDVIIEQGREGHGFYILKSGSVEIYKNGLLLNVLSFPGTIFGEMGDILGKPRSASIKARTKCTIVHCDESDVHAIIRDRPEIAVKIIRTLAARLERTTAKLAEQFQEAPVWAVETKTPFAHPAGKGEHFSVGDNEPPDPSVIESAAFPAAQVEQAKTHPPMPKPKRPAKKGAHSSYRVST